MKNETMTAAEFSAMSSAAGGASSERSEQEALVKWAAASKIEYPALRLLFHIPNGGNRTARSGARMKRLGAKAGVPDLCLPVPRPAPERAQLACYGALWIEMKAEDGRMGDTQAWWAESLRQAGHAHAVCRSWTEARGTILSYLDGRFQPTPGGSTGNGAESTPSTQKPSSDV